MAKEPAGTGSNNPPTGKSNSAPPVGTAQRRSAPPGRHSAPEAAPSAERSPSGPQSNAAPPPVTRTMPNPMPSDADAHARRRRIEEAAYYRAARRGFAPGGEHEDWLEAEKEVDRGTPTDKKLEDNDFPSPK